MKYKVGDKVRVRRDLETTVMYGGLCVIDEMLKKKIVTITSVHEGYYKVVEVLKQWRKDHEKKEVEVEFARTVRVIEDTGSRRRCVYEEDVTEVKDETFKMSMKRILEEYCKEHEGKFFTVYEEICRVKE